MLKIYFLVFYDFKSERDEDLSQELLLSTLDDHFIRNMNRIAFLNVSNERKVKIANCLEEFPRLQNIRQAYQNSKFLGAVLSIFKDFFEFLGIIDNLKTQKKKENWNIVKHYGFLFLKQDYLNTQIKIAFDSLATF
jgi:hypothetical protein